MKAGSRRRRRLVFVALLLGLVVGAVEAGGFATWWALTGQPFSWSAAAQLRAAVTGEEQGAEAGVVDAATNPGMTLHPYLGFVASHELGEQQDFAVNDYGYMDTEAPVQPRREDRYVVGVTGGSVALMMVLFAEDVLRRELARSPVTGGREVQIVCMALGGYKQPQQLVSTQLALLRGGHFDLVLNLDGFNEVALVQANQDQGVPGWFPNRWGALMDRAPTPPQLLRMGRLAAEREARASAARSADAVWWSPTLQTVWLVADRRAEARSASLAAAVLDAAEVRSFAAVGPGTEGRDGDASRAEMVQLWRRASLQLRTLVEDAGGRYFHFLQPNQYVPDAKPIGTEEAAVAIADGEGSFRPWVEHGYPLLRAAGAELRSDGVAFTDLSGVFRDHPEPLYVDTCCHVGRRGSELLAAAVSAAVRAQLDLEGFVPEALTVTPSPVVLSSPVEQVQLRVSAAADGGREVDVAARGMGTRYEVRPRGAVAVSATGSVRALRRGRAELEVHAPKGAAQAVVELQASWPDVLVLDDAPRGAPALRLVGDAGDARPEVAVQGLPEQGFRLLAASAEPLPAQTPPGQEAFGVASTLLGAAGASVAAASPAAVPSGGRPLFLRAYVVNGEGRVAAASNMLVLTRD